MIAAGVDMDAAENRLQGLLLGPLLWSPYMISFLRVPVPSLNYYRTVLMYGAQCRTSRFGDSCT